MSKGSQSKKATLASGLTARSPAFSASRSRRRARRPKASLPRSTAPRANRTDPALPLHQRGRLQVVKDPGQLPTESVESLAKYKPGSRKYEVSLTFSGEAGATISGLMTELGVNSPNELVKLTIALLASARGKEILLRDPMTGVVEVVEL
jgi:hypothetical protein